MKKPWVTTVNLESEVTYGKADNNSRLIMLSSIIHQVAIATTGNGVILFPAGYFSCHHALEKCTDFESLLSDYLPRFLKGFGNRSIVACFGIDYGRRSLAFDHKKSSSEEKPEVSEILIIRDQIVYAVDKKGVLASGLKFFPTRWERKHINISDITQRENIKRRIFSLNGKSFFLAMCNDVFGINKMKLQNPGVDFILNPVHLFTPEHFPYFFARHGLLEASKVWKCKTFGASVFLNREVKNWTSGVCLRKICANKKLSYSQFRLPEKVNFNCNFSYENAEIRLFN